MLISVYHTISSVYRGYPAYFSTFRFGKLNPMVLQEASILCSKGGCAEEVRAEPCGLKQGLLAAPFCDGAVITAQEYSRDFLALKNTRTRILRVFKQTGGGETFIYCAGSRTEYAGDQP